MATALDRIAHHLRDSVPPQWTVIVMSDRGLYAPWLYQHLVRVGWHPFMRINKQGDFRPLGKRNTVRSRQRHRR